MRTLENPYGRASIFWAVFVAVFVVLLILIFTEEVKHQQASEEIEYVGSGFYQN